MTIVYSFSDDTGTYYVPTKRAAISAARAAITASGGDDTFVSVSRIVIASGLPRRELACRLLNNESFAAEQEDVPL